MQDIGSLNTSMNFGVVLIVFGFISEGNVVGNNDTYSIVIYKILDGNISSDRTIQDINNLIWQTDMIWCVKKMRRISGFINRHFPKSNPHQVRKRNRAKFGSEIAPTLETKPRQVWKRNRANFGNNYTIRIVIQVNIHTLWNHIVLV